MFGTPLFGSYFVREDDTKKWNDVIETSDFFPFYFAERKKIAKFALDR
jgi:hypothetical protein